MAAKKYVPDIVHGSDGYASLAQKRIRITTSGAPHRIKSNFDSRFLDCLNIDNFTQARKIHASRVNRLRFGLAS